MASYKSDIRNSILNIVGIDDNASMVMCEVVSVDEAKRTCNVTTISNDVELEIPDVMLQASVDNGFIIVPSVGSNVIILNQEKIHPCVVMYSSVSKVLAIQPLWQFNKGDNAGMVKVIELTQKLNALENLFNSLQSIFSSWVVVPNDGGGALKTLLATWNTPNITPTTQTEIEDTKITH